MQKTKILFHSLVSLIIVSICLLYFINKSDNGFSINHIFHAIQIGWFYLLIACVLLIVSVYLRAVRWRLLFDSDHDTLNPKFLFHSQLIGYFINNIFPIRIGDFARSYVVSKKTNYSNSYILGTILMERFLDILMILFFCMILIWNYGLQYFQFSVSFQLYAMLIIIIFIVSYLIYRSIIFIPQKIQNIFIQLWDGFTGFQSASVGLVFLLSGLIWFIYCSNVFLIQKIFQFDLNMLDCMLLLVGASFLQMIPTGFASAGIFHLGVSGILENQLSKINTENFVFTLFLYSYVVYTTLGGYYFISKGKVTIQNLYKDITKTS